MLFPCLKFFNGLTYAGWAWLSCLCSHRAFTSSIRAFIILYHSVFSPPLYCEILEGKSSLLYLKPQDQAQCGVQNTLNKC